MRKTWKQMISTACVVCVLASTFSVNGMGFAIQVQAFAYAGVADEKRLSGLQN